MKTLNVVPKSARSFLYFFFFSVVQNETQSAGGPLPQGPVTRATDELYIGT